MCARERERVRVCVFVRARLKDFLNWIASRLYALDPESVTMRSSAVSLQHIRNIAEITNEEYLSVPKVVTNFFWWCTSTPKLISLIARRSQTIMGTWTTWHMGKYVWLELLYLFPISNVVMKTLFGTLYAILNPLLSAWGLPLLTWIHKTVKGTWTTRYFFEV